MAELSSRNTTDARGDPAETHGQEGSASAPDAPSQDIRKRLTSRVFVAAVVLPQALRRDPSSLRRDTSTWLEKSPEDQQGLRKQLNSSYKRWTSRELKAFEAAAKRTPAEMEAAKKELSVRAFGARLLMTKAGSYVGWLALSPDSRKAELKTFGEKYEEWIATELKKRDARAGKGAGVRPPASLSKEIAKKSQPMRSRAVHTLEARKRTAASPKGPEPKGRSRGKGSGSDNTR